MAHRAPAERHPRRAGDRAHTRASRAALGPETAGRCQPSAAPAHPARTRSGRGAQGVRTCDGQCAVQHGPAGDLPIAPPRGRAVAAGRDAFGVPGADVQPAHRREERRRGAAGCDPAARRHASDPSQPGGRGAAHAGRPRFQRTARRRQGGLRCRGAPAPRHAGRGRARGAARGGGRFRCGAVIGATAQSRGRGPHAHGDARAAGFLGG